jgi:replication factor C subunit 3/5
LQRESGLALQDIVSEIYNFARLIELPAKSRVYLLQNLADIEYRLAEGANEKIQLSSLVGTFKLAQENIA